MPSSPNLHRAGKLPDWEKIPNAKRNQWQTMAAASKGIITPANFISILGAVITIIGLVKIVNEVNLLNISMIVIGRAADILDGYVAHATGTKSPLGEIVDAATDKILAFIAVGALAIGELAPAVIVIMVLLYSVFNSVISIIAKLRRAPIHPSREGKLAGATCWAMISLYLLYAFTVENGALLLSPLVLIAALITNGLFIWLALKSMSEYYKLSRLKL